MKIVFRVDSAPEIGAGHVTRCLTLATSLRDNEAICVFVVRNHDVKMTRMIESKGFYVIRLNKDLNKKININDYQTWIGSSWENDAKETYFEYKKIFKEKIDWIIVDHYGLDYQWENFFRRKGIKIGVIDDLANRMHSADFLLDQTFGRCKTEYNGFIDKKTNMFIGESYCLLREEFAQFKEISIQKRKNTNKIKEILVNFGSTDIQNNTVKALEGLKQYAQLNNIVVSVIIGNSCPHIADINKCADIMPYEVNVHVNCKNVAEIITRADAAIGAAGASTWERCFLGLPSILIKVAENQGEAISRVVNNGSAIEYKGCLDSGVDLANALDYLINNYIKISSSGFNMGIAKRYHEIISLILNKNMNNFIR
jgi:UDP-2,4-diacetamido-2,4,6-trideoxy-beta-L-altropyranose hydrolase